MAAPLPALLGIARVSTATQTALNRFLEVFPPLVKHSQENEPDTLSYYFFTNNKPDDHFFYGFEAYTDASALSDVHAKSDALQAWKAIITEEKLCTVNVEKFRPVAGFRLRQGEIQQPVGHIVIQKVQGGEATKAGLIKLAQHVEKVEADGCRTFVVMEQLETGELCTFERYDTKAYYEQTHIKSAAFCDVSAGGPEPIVNEFTEANLGFLQK